MTWEEVLNKYDRIAITGGPLTGKTTLAMSVPTKRMTLHTDGFRHEEWAQQPIRALLALTDVKRFIIEGVQVPRVLRKGLEVDVVVWLSKPKHPRTKNQDSFAKAVETIYKEWKRSHPKVKEVRL